MPEGRQAVLFCQLFEHRFSLMPEGGVTEVMACGDGAGKFRIETEIGGNGVADRFHMLDMFDAGADVVVGHIEEDLRFALQPTVGQRVQNAVIVPLKGRTDMPSVLHSADVAASPPDRQANS